MKRFLFALSAALLLSVGGFAVAGDGIQGECAFRASLMTVIAQRRDEGWSMQRAIVTVQNEMRNGNMTAEGYVTLLEIIADVYAHADVKPADLGQAFYKRCLKANGITEAAK